MDTLPVLAFNEFNIRRYLFEGKNWAEIEFRMRAFLLTSRGVFRSSGFSHVDWLVILLK